MTTAATLHAEREIVRYTPYGAARALFLCRDREVCLDGPAGTGKSYAMLQKAHLSLLKYPGSRRLLLRKTLVDLKGSTLVTFREAVLHPSEGVRFWSAKADEPAHYAYPNGSKYVVGGLDKPGKIMSTDYDGIDIDEAWQLTLDEFESLTTRIGRPGNHRTPYAQIVACVNPQGPKHWLNQRMLAGQMARLASRHEDNPTVTESYLETLRALSGVRRARLYSGLWMAAEGAIYEDEWDYSKHVVPRHYVEIRHATTGRAMLPAAWPRYLSVDFGYTHPFVCLWWAIDPDGRLYCYREIYRTQRLVEDHAAEIKRLSRWGHEDGDPLPRAIICDHDAEGRATLERHLGMMTLAANKTVSAGIQAVQARLRPVGDERPRLLYLEGSVQDVDPLLRDRHAPASTVEEYESYVWSRGSDGSFKEEPEKENDHGMDATRYMVANRDLVPGFAKQGPTLF